MPHRALRPCAHQGCPALVHVGEIYCAAHAGGHKQDYARVHPEYFKLYNNKRWRLYRKMFLAEHPLCVQCGRGASVVDHIEPHQGVWDKFWEPSNHQALCAQCHNTKTAKEAGWGRGG